MRRLILCLLLLAADACLVRAEAPFRFESTPGKLPKDIVPVQYDLHLSPDIEKHTFTGSETVEIEIRKATDRCVFNAANLEISSAVLTPDAPADARAIPLTPTLDAAQETCTLPFPQALPAGHYHLALRFAGKINQDSAGLFAASYEVGSHQETVLCTQMEPADARRVFPGWDEPAFRAKFRVAVTVPRPGWSAFSNMPVATRAPASGGGGEEWTFQTTPPMASYLVVVALGDLATLDGEADGVAIHVVAPRDRVQNGRYALEAAGKILRYYNEYFGVKYPLPKLDLIAVAGGGVSGFGAMENWGGIVFAEKYLLYDPATSSQATQQAIFETLAHEMAHQWFGDLVTMGWWDNIWLNEGFAEWMGESAADRFNPDWQYWNSIASNKDFAMGSDARSTTHPIQQRVVSEMDSLRSFDEITYNKGQSFIRMLESYLGPEKFREGVRQYMKAHAYGNATTADLWAALDAASGQSVSAIAAPWTEQPGFPMVNVSRDPARPGEVRLAQRRFTVHDPDAAPLHWKIPVTYAAVGSGAKGSLLLDESAASIPTPPDGSPLKFNAGNTGYYRVLYDEATLRPLLDRVNDLPAPDQTNLLNDSWAAVRADLGPVTTYLGLVRALRPGQTNPLVWKQTTSVAWTIDRLYGGDPAARAAWRQAMIAVLRPVLEHYGWQPAASDPAPVRELRAELIETLGFFDDPATVRACQERFAAFLKDPGALPPDIRGQVCNVVGRHADAATYDALLARARQASGDEQKSLFYAALATAADPALAQRTLELTLGEDLSAGYLTILLGGVAAEGEQPAVALKFLLDHMDKLSAKIPAMVKGRLVPMLYSRFSDVPRAEELERYGAQPGTGVDPAQVKKYAEVIRTNADLKARLLPEVNRWSASK